MPDARKNPRTKRLVSEKISQAAAEIYLARIPIPITFRGLAGAIRSRIENGSLAPQTSIPTIRSLSRQLGLSRSMVARAYATLREEGFIEGARRRGTRVCALACVIKRHAPRASHNARWYSQSLNCHPLELNFEWDLRPGQVYINKMPLAIWRRACREAGRKLLPSGYGDPAGERRLREGIAAYLGRTRALSIAPSNVIVTNGSGAAIALLARSLLRRGDIAALEDPGYQRANSEFERAGAKIFWMPVEFETGHRIDLLPEGRAAPVILHLTPARQYPLGMTLPEEKRDALIKWARRNGSLIIENDYDQEFCHGAERLPAMISTASDCVALVGTFSKALSPSLRIGFIAGPTQLIERVRAMIGQSREQVPWSVQQTLLWLLSSGFVERNVSRSRNHYIQLRNAIQESLATFSGIIDLHGTDCGLHVVLRFAKSLDARSVWRALRDRGIALELVGSEHRPLNALALGYGHLQLDELRRALKVISAQLNLILSQRGFKVLAN